MDSLHEIADLLAVQGIHEGFPRERMELAGKLFGLSISCADLELLHRSVIRSTPPSDTLRVLASVLRSGDALVARIADLRNCSDLQARAAYPGAGQWTKPTPTMDSPEQWEHATRRRVAYALVIADRKPLQEVAVFMGISPETVQDLVDEERLSRPRPAPAQPTAEPSPLKDWDKLNWDQRLRLVRKEMGL
jgi:hypothetical protein